MFSAAKAIGRNGLHYINSVEPLPTTEIIIKGIDESKSKCLRVSKERSLLGSQTVVHSISVSSPTPPYPVLERTQVFMRERAAFN